MKAHLDGGPLLVDEQGVWMGGRLLATRDSLTQGFVASTGEKTLLHLERSIDPPVVVAVDDEGEALRALDALGLGARQRAARMSLTSGLSTVSVEKQAALFLVPLFVVIVGTMVMAVTSTPWATSAFLSVSVLVALAWSLTLAFAPLLVDIGTDGVTTTWFGKRRYIPFAEVGVVERYDQYLHGRRQVGVRLHLASGELLSLSTGQSDAAVAEAARLAARVEQARRGSQGRAERPGDLLVRGDRRWVDWVKELRRIGAGAATPRCAAVPRDVLLDVLEDDAAPAVERASAAVAALASDDPDVGRRVRVAAEASASPRLRVALGAIAEAPTNEARIADALSALDDEPAPHASRVRRARPPSG